MKFNKVAVLLVARGCEHRVCVEVESYVPTQLRAGDDERVSCQIDCIRGCRVPSDIRQRVMAALRKVPERWLLLGAIPLLAL